MTSHVHSTQARADVRANVGPIADKADIRTAWLDGASVQRRLGFSMYMYKMDFNTSALVYGHTHLKATVPVPLTESKQVLARSVLGRVTTREYRVL